MVFFERPFCRAVRKVTLLPVVVLVALASSMLILFAQGNEPEQRIAMKPPGAFSSEQSGPTILDPIFISCDFLHEESPAAVDITSRLYGDSEKNRSTDPASEGVSLLRGRCQIQQGDWELNANQIVIWKSTVQDHNRLMTRIVVYAEQDVQLKTDAKSESTQPVLVELVSSAEITTVPRHEVQLLSAASDPFLERAKRARSRHQQTALNQPRLIAPDNAIPLSPAEIDFDSLTQPLATTAQRHIVVSPRSFGIGFDVKSYLSEESSPAEQITVISQGVNIVVEGIGPVDGVPVGALDLSADQVVIWTQANASGTFSPEMFQDQNTPMQLYLEGNIEIRQGNHVMRASRAYYDIREDRAVLLDSEMRVNVPDMQGDLKLRADRIRQLSHDSFHAENAWVSGSEFGVPTYRMEAGDIFIENRYDRGWVGGGDPEVDPQTGLQVARPKPWITSLNNKFRVGEAPIFFAPYVSGPAEDPHIPIESLTLGQDNIFGGQLKTVWNLSKLLGLKGADDLDWNLQADMYTERGFWLGTDATYAGCAPIGTAGSYFGETEAVWINDWGTDNLGLDRRDLDVASNTRGRALWRHRQHMSDSLWVTGELGFLSDRNFLEQYYEEEWDQGKDNETLISINHQEDNIATSIMGRFQLNEFETETNWLPKADLTILGEPLLWDRLVYSSRSSAGYGQLRPGDAPDDPNDLYVPLTYTPEAEGVVLSTRHELSMPFNLGPVKFDPYLLGEAAYWQDDGFTNNNLNRFYGSAGIRANLMLWKTYPHLFSPLLGINGLAHKQNLGVDYYFADSTQDLSDVPQYNEFDENAQERFRTRLIFNTFGFMNNALLPTQFDPRNYAVRSGAARNVSSPYFELVDDQQVARFNWNHRLQTKVGPPERQRIKDWMTLDLGLSYFPDADSDNFGEDFGLLTANYMWDVGSRTKILANGEFDFFEDAPQAWDVGFLTQRSTRGSLYLGYRNIQAGPLESQLLTASASYAMSQKWIATFGTAYDIAENQDRGQSFTITGIRSDFLIHLGLSVDSSKGNFGVGFMIEPRLGPIDGSSNRLSSLLGTQ
ncbi:MAG TPA: hypothetical protein DIW81_20550 [Planctomycetaceae bacterium]|nr:hypothetical protein [Rubinisphaera sp.]HCS53944.1 hypothetical protein [Planctomycetaceae bacterium]|tara:strand:- start:19578 stop:22754 length:3177 start_codon:yes stop_codon:yes gene_type:complete